MFEAPRFSCEAIAGSPRRAPVTVTVVPVAAPSARLGGFQVTVRVKTSGSVPVREAGTFTTEVFVVLVLDVEIPLVMSEPIMFGPISNSSAKLVLIAVTPAPAPLKIEFEMIATFDVFEVPSGPVI